MEHNYKKILIAYDHSLTSKVALKKAVEIGKKFDAEYNTIFVLTDNNQDIEFEAFKFIEDIQDSEKVNLNFHLKKGKPFKEILAQEKKWGAELIVMGTHGKEGFMPSWLGSTAFKVASSAHQPVICIQESGETANFKHILVPLENSPESRQKLGHAAGFAKAFGATVHILGLSKYKDKETQHYVHVYVAQGEDFMANRGVPCDSEIIFGVNVSDTCIQKAADKQCGLIVMMTESESTGMFMGTVAQQLINHSPIPVMAIHNVHVEGTGGSGY